MLSLAINNVLHHQGKDLWKYGAHDGRARRVAEFDGTGDYAIMDFFDDIEGASSLTVSLWVNLPSEPVITQYFFMHGDSISSNPPFLQLGVGTTGGKKYFELSDWHADETADLLNDGDDSVDFTDSDYLNKWIHVILRWDKDTDSGKVQYMIDGSGSFASTTTSTTSDVPAMSGTEAQQRMTLASYYISALGGSTGEMAVKISELAMWRARLEDDDCSLLAAGVNPLDISGVTLNHYWPLSATGEDFGAATPRDEADTTAEGDATFSGSV